MDDHKSKPHQERLKPDIELKVTGEDQSSESLSAALGLGTPVTAVAHDDSNNGKKESSASDARDVRIAVLAERKAKEQTFLAEYKKRQIRTRIKFGTCTAIVLALFWSAMYFVCSKNEKAVQAVAQFQPVAMFACLGENDMAYYLMSNFTNKAADKNTESKLVEERIKILDQGIQNYEASGRPSIFTRLGAAQMLVRLGDRSAALKFAEPLMKRFPDLPSNYFWLARVDFDNLDLLNTLRDYDKAAEIVERSPKEVGQSFYSQFINATQAAIDAGQYDQALRFLNIAEKYGLQDYERRGLLCQILIAKSDALAIPELKKTDMWSEEISNYNQRNLKKVNQIASEMSWYKAYKTGRLITGVYKPDLLFSAALGLGDYSKAIELADSAGHSAPRSRQLATVALAQNDPRLALSLISRWCGPKSDYADKYEYIRAEALLRLHRASEAMSVVDEVLTSSDYGDTVTKAKYYLPFRIIKAKALYDIGKYQEALAEADKILAINPHLIRARLIKIDTLNKLNDASGAAREQAATVAELQLALTQSGNVTGATHDR